MSLLRDDPVALDDAVLAAARDLGHSPSFIEKDYWITQVLRALCVTQSNDFVLKGGTSLSKGFGIIDRFSEDVDILFVPQHDSSAKDIEERLKQASEVAGEHVGMPLTAKPWLGRGRDASRGDLLHYEPRVAAEDVGAAHIGDVLLETKVGVGSEPSLMVTIEPLLADVVRRSDEAFEDLEPFRVRAQAPARTLVEKVALVHHVASGWPGDAPDDQRRFGRHYYDIYYLLLPQKKVVPVAGSKSYTQDLERWQEGFEPILRDIERVSEQYYGGYTPRPKDGFAMSPAFVPGDEGLRAWLEQAFDGALSLAGPGPQPSFGKILKLVSKSRDLL